MIIKTQPDEIENFLNDASNLKGGNAGNVYFPENVVEISEILRESNANKIPVTISGAKTGTVGGAIPFGGNVLSLDKLNRIKEIAKINEGGYAIVETAVTLTDFQKATDAKNLFYAPDPTEWSCQMGGTVATNASGARSFKYGATRNYVQKLEIVLPTGEIISVRRGETSARNGKINIPVSDCGASLIVNLPSYKMPKTRKHAAGYFNAPEMDLIDLFIGAEGTLGVITEIELGLLPKAESILSGVVFFEDEKDLLNFVTEIRNQSFEARAEVRNPNSEIRTRIDSRVLEYIDRNALDFMREKFAEIPENMAGAILFEQETTEDSEETLLNQWFAVLENHNADIEKSWFATNDADLRKMREFRHTTPVAVNEFIVRHGQKKVSTDIAVSDAEFPKMLKFYQQTLKDSGLKAITFGHIGDNHLHVNILPRNELEAMKARHVYGQFIARACIVGGTVSAEHGIGKLKKPYLNAMFGERYLNEMLEVKRTFDPNFILNRGVML